MKSLQVHEKSEELTAIGKCEQKARIVEIIAMSGGSCRMWCVIRAFRLDDSIL